METRRILIVDDDLDIRSLVAEYLGSHGYATAEVEDGAAMWARLEERPFDLVILDLTLPREDGLALCRDIRSKMSLPVIMLTARASSLDRIVGLEMGADDYVTKPFEPRELLARVRNVLRRVYEKPSESPSAPRRIRFSEWQLDLPQRHLVDSAGVVVTLSTMEYRLLTVFLENPNRVLKREQILDLTRIGEVDTFDRAIDLQVSRLRQKIRDDARAPRIIKTIRAEGYLFAADIVAEP